jgi:hypothetical protein
MNNPNQQLDQQNKAADLSKEVSQILNILDELENFTIELRKKVMAELRTNNNIIQLKLNDIK